MMHHRIRKIRNTRRSRRLQWLSRFRSDERGVQLTAKLTYIRDNPVAGGLCARAEDWPWIINLL